MKWSIYMNKNWSLLAAFADLATQIHAPPPTFPFINKENIEKNIRLIELQLINKMLLKLL